MWRTEKKNLYDEKKRKIVIISEVFFIRIMYSSFRKSSHIVSEHTVT